MGKVINFNKARKRKQREQAEQQAAANRLRYGRTKAEKLRDAAAEEQARRRMDQLHRETPPADGDNDDPSAAQ